MAAALLVTALGAGTASGQTAQRIHHSAVNAADTSAHDTQGSTAIAALGNNLIAAFTDTGSISQSTGNHLTGYATSSNGGLSFTDRNALPGSALGDGGAPSLAIDPVTPGRAYLATTTFGGQDQLQVFRSTDNGVTWGSLVNGAPGLAGDTIALPKLATDSFAGPGLGTVYLCFTETTNGIPQVRVTHSTDGGATFTPNTGSFAAVFANGCDVVVAPDHSVYVFYFRSTQNTANPTPTLEVVRSTDGGNTFGAAMKITALVNTSNEGDLFQSYAATAFPHAAVNPATGHLVVTFADRTGSDPGNVYSTVSKNNGATWSARAVVGEDSTGLQFNPSVAVSPTGSRVMFAYTSASHDPAGILLHRRARLANQQAGGGLQYPSRSFQLSPDTPPTIGQDTLVPNDYLTDFDGLVATSTQFVTTWTDSRAGDGFHRLQPDVYFAAIDQPPTTADVGVSVTASPSSVELGQDTAVTVGVTATGGNANDVYVHLKQAVGLRFANANGGRCTITDGDVDCYLGSIPAGTTQTVTVTATGSVKAGTRTVSATATTSSVDGNAANDTGSGTVTVTTGTRLDSKSYSSGDLALPINDSSTFEVPLDVPDEGSVVRVDARVRLNHTFDGDVDLALVSPLGTVVDLSTDNGGGGDNYGSGANTCSGTKTVFYDGAAKSITAVAAPFAGTFQPEQPLDTLTGEPSDGQWRLRVGDDAGGDTGTLGCFQLFISRIP